jgi:ribosomal protein S18 acetylase RimI-like enzyme
MIIREYLDGDFEQFRDMVFALYKEDPEGLPLTIEKMKLTVAEAQGHPDKLKIYMFCDGEEISGYSIINFFWCNEYGGDIVNIDEIYVKPTARNRGVATQFIKGLPSLFPGAKATKLEASQSNYKAIDYYRRLGFMDAPNLHMLISFPLLST